MNLTAKIANYQKKKQVNKSRVTGVEGKEQKRPEQERTRADKQLKTPEKQ